MNSLNSVLLEGNLTRDPVLTETTKGTPVCTFGMAVNRYYKQNEETVKEVSFFDVETWTRLAQYCSSQLKKGSHIRVVGRLKQDRWENSDGNTRSKVKVVGEHMEIQERKGQQGSDYGGGEDSREEEKLVI